MSTGGIFTIITNDGKQDRMLMATDLLKSRLRRIVEQRVKQGLEPTPTLADIEKTHVLYVNSHFKPFAALGYEYNKVRPSSGTVSLNSTVQFSIPQFGDFFHDMVLHLRLGAVAAATAYNTWRWCAFPGERVAEKVRFSVNGNPLDEYVNHDYCFYRQFELPDVKRSGYYRCMGQQELKQATVVGSTAGAGSSSTAMTTYSYGAQKIGASCTDYVANGYSFQVGVTTGYQTVKTGTAHSTEPQAGVNNRRTDILEVTVPLMFWFNRDPRLAIPSVCIPFGQRYIEVELSSLANLCGGMAVASFDNSSAELTGATLSISGTEVVVCDLYINNIFVNPEVHDIFIRRIGFNLVRVHRRQVARISNAQQELLMNNLKWPVEHIYFGFKPTAQVTAPSSNSAWTTQYADAWCDFASSKPVRGSLNISTTAHTTGESPTNPTAVLATQWLEPAPLVESITFKAQGIPIYNDLPAILFNQYIPLVFGSGINTPKDLGLYVVTFNLHPGQYQPSGHLNVSRVREFYIEMKDETPQNGIKKIHANDKVGGSSNVTSDLIASASALNFLLISDGSAVLRYST